MGSETVRRELQRLRRAAYENLIIVATLARWWKSSTMLWRAWLGVRIHLSLAQGIRCGSRRSQWESDPAANPKLRQVGALPELGRTNLRRLRAAIRHPPRYGPQDECPSPDDPSICRRDPDEIARRLPASERQFPDVAPPSPWSRPRPL